MENKISILEKIRIINNLLDFKKIDPRGSLNTYNYVIKNELKILNDHYITKDAFLIYIEDYLINKIKLKIQYEKNRSNV